MSCARLKEWTFWRAIAHSTLNTVAKKVGNQSTFSGEVDRTFYRILYCSVGFPCANRIQIHQWEPSVTIKAAVGADWQCWRRAYCSVCSSTYFTSCATITRFGALWLLAPTEQTTTYISNPRKIIAKVSTCINTNVKSARRNVGDSHDKRFITTFSNLTWKCCSATKIYKTNGRRSRASGQSAKADQKEARY